MGSVLRGYRRFYNLVVLGHDLGLFIISMTYLVFRLHRIIIPGPSHAQDNSRTLRLHRINLWSSSSSSFLQVSPSSELRFGGRRWNLESGRMNSSVQGLRFATVV